MTSYVPSGALNADIVGPVAMDYVRVEVQETVGPAGTYLLGYPTFMGKIWRRVTPL